MPLTATGAGCHAGRGSLVRACSLASSATRLRARPRSCRPRCHEAARFAARTSGIRAGPGRSRRSPWLPPPARGPGRKPRSGRTTRDRQTGRQQLTAIRRGRCAPSPTASRPAADARGLLSSACLLTVGRRSVRRDRHHSVHRAGPERHSRRRLSSHSRQLSRAQSITGSGFARAARRPSAVSAAPAWRSSPQGSWAGSPRCAPRAALCSVQVTGGNAR